ncbi:ABC transporter permease [Flavitalea sp.]|nr:FtsX-like permease family protein [Flavitalea sp.]
MFRNYIKTAIRSLIKGKTFSFINIFGLTVGLTAFLLIALYIFDELTYDASHKNGDRIYRVITELASIDGKQIKRAGSAYQVGQRARTDLPGVADVASIAPLGRANISSVGNTNVFYEDFFIANPGFLTTFDFPLLQGDRKTALNGPHTVILTESSAKKMFGTTDVIGKQLNVDRDSVPCKITAVLKDFPVNSHISFNFCFSEDAMGVTGFRNYLINDWSSGTFASYLLLDADVDPTRIEAQVGELVSANNKSANKDKRRFLLQPLKDIHFYSGDIEGGMTENGNITYIYVFAVLGFFVLLIASINYMNLTTARFVNRAKEVAVRKVAGASRNNLITQFTSEAFVVTLISILLALALVKLLLPQFNDFTGKKLVLGFQTDYRIWFGIVIIALFVGLFSGLYPAFFQSRLKPIQLFKRKINIGRGNISLRSALVVFQFAIAIVMIVATIVVYTQLKYVNSKDMGFSKDQLVVIDINSGKVRRQAETIKTELGKIPQVKDVSVSSRVPGEWKNLVTIKALGEKIKSIEGADMYFLGIDDKFLQTYSIKLLEGRNFYNTNADSAGIIINQVAAKEFGISKAADQLISISVGDEAFKARAVGIVADFNYQSLRQPVAPLIMAYEKNPVQMIDYFTAKVNAQNIPETLKQMEAVVQGIDQQHLFEYHFLDKQWALFYQQDRIRETVFMIVAGLTILIACLGLFGLATYAAEQRIKEIGIRRVLGASVPGILVMFSKDFLRLVLISIVIAFPISIWAMSKWLDDFAYRVNISWWMLTMAGGLAIFIAIFTSSFQAARAAITNPVKSLRTDG